MDKQKLVGQILTELTVKYETLCQAAKASHDIATHEDSKAENEYDTRGLEASYLAGAQSKRAIELEQAISIYKTLKIKDFGPEDSIDLTALVELESEGRNSFYFIGPEGGGMKLHQEGETVVVITPESPLGKSLMEKEIDDDVEVTKGIAMKSYSIVDLY
ncbi:MAG: GreA/GreB family elongation factor [Proteobacteria bacterium]|nr:GreA/GreB family elongation factor [Pseudomonadota bacterium]